MTDGPDSHTQRMIDANVDIFKHSTTLKFTPVDDLKAIERTTELHFKAEDYFYRLFNSLKILHGNQE